jgi:hypothetical protein
MERLDAAWRRLFSSAPARQEKVDQPASTSASASAFSKYTTEPGGLETGSVAPAACNGRFGHPSRSSIS